MSERNHRHPEMLASDFQNDSSQNNMTVVMQALKSVEASISAVWPLKDYVAVNPYLGFIDQEFLSARHSLRKFSDLELLMPVNDYREQFAAGLLDRSDIDAAVDELVADGVEGAERIDVNQVLALLRQPGPKSPTADTEFTKSTNPDRRLRPYTESLDHYNGSQWTEFVLEEISKHCSAHYDNGQAAWPSPWRHLPLYLAWHSAVQHDRNFELLGVPAFRSVVKQLPADPHAALATLLNIMKVPQQLWSDFLLCEALSMPGWSAWTKYQVEQAERNGEESTDFVGLLAMRLAYEVALVEQFDFRINWSSVAKLHGDLELASGPTTDEELLRYALLKASENAFRKQLLNAINEQQQAVSPTADGAQKLAQMVFCIDVRSERYRRHLEAQAKEIETFGFAGFFGLPLEFVKLGEEAGNPQVPALISPKFTVHEEVISESSAVTQSAKLRRTYRRSLRKVWKEFQASAATCFAAVETTGLFYGFGLLGRSLGKSRTQRVRFDGVHADHHAQLGPTLNGLQKQGLSEEQLVEMAESVLRGIGIVDNFARLVVFCGHGSQCENNPLQAGLDCGACGGHSGEPNARFAAQLLNDVAVRAGLEKRGLAISAETHFLGAVHNTTTDEIEFFDLHLVPESHQEDVRTLQGCAKSASQQTRLERLPRLPGESTHDLFRRSTDWSEIRPEWGLAGNAAFIAGPRELTSAVSLEGRCFLHSYDSRKDPGFAVLKQILTAPLVVANWINMQYYASTVDPIHFGSGNKTVHNVVGQFGIFSGNGGDLMTGLPWQSVHDGQRYQHHPLRLLAVIAAPREAIEKILSENSMVHNLVTKGWLQLVALDEQKFYRFSERSEWEELPMSSPQSPARELAPSE